MAEPLLAKVTIFPDGEGLPYPDTMNADGTEYDLFAAMPLYRERTLPSDLYEVVPVGITISPPPGYGIEIDTKLERAEKDKIIIWRAPGTVEPSPSDQISLTVYNIGVLCFPMSRGLPIASLRILPISDIPGNYYDLSKVEPPVWMFTNSTREYQAIINAERVKERRRQLGLPSPPTRWQRLVNLLRFKS